MKTRNKFYNPNPSKRTDVGDCVVRALCKATDNDWDTVFKALVEIAFEMKCMPSSDDAWKEYLSRNGFAYRKLSIKKGSKRPTPQTFSASNREGTYVLVVAGHIVTSQDGYFWDTWDCGAKGMYGYWEKVEQTSKEEL